MFKTHASQNRLHFTCLMAIMIVVLEGGDSESYHSKNKAKRVRTTFTEEQLQVLQANFQLDSNPDGQDLERIAQITGLSKRVTQVWFQNSRARQKKHLHTGKVKSTPSGLRMYFLRTIFKTEIIKLGEFLKKVQLLKPNFFLT